MFKKSLFMFGVGGILYVGLEFLWRGRSHISMFFAGGTSAAAIFSGCRHRPLCRAKWPVKCLFGSAVITAVEFCTGAVMNLWLRKAVWDYSSLPMNVLGQICLPFSVLWFFLTLPVLWLGKLIDRKR